MLHQQIQMCDKLKYKGILILSLDNIMSTVILANDIIPTHLYTQPSVTSFQDVPLDVEQLAVIQHGSPDTLYLGDFTLHNNLQDMKNLKERFSNVDD